MRIPVQAFAVLVLTLTWPCRAHGNIAFDTDGRWATSFEYGAECVKHWQFYDEIGYCQDIANDGTVWTGWPPSYNEHDPDRKLTSIVADAAHTGNSGARYWVFDGTNRQSPGIRVDFPEPQPEFWIRYYVRYQEGFNWATQHYEKQLYFRTPAAPVLIPGMANGTFYVHSSGNTGATNIYSSLTWNDHMGTPDNTSNGEWMCWEMYVKMDTDGTDGIVRLWIDENLVLDRSDINHSGGDAEARDGWTWFGFHSNQNEIDNLNGPIGADYAHVDYDDMAIYIRRPPNTDVHGIPFIGPVHLDPENGPDPEPQAPELTILAPEDGAVVHAPEVTVEGTVDPARPSTVVTVNGGPATHDDGAFAATVDLVLGENEIVAIAADEEGREGMASITVVYERGEEQVPCEPPCALGYTCIGGVCVSADWACEPQKRRQLIITPTSDVFIGGSSNQIHETDIRLYTWPDETPANAILMKLDLSELPSEAEVQEALLRLRLIETDGLAECTPYRAPLHRVLNHDPDLSEATWDTYDGTNAWTAPGAQADVSGTVYDLRLVGQELGFEEWEATELVLEWLAAPHLNFGLLLNADDQAPGDCFRYFAATRHEVAEWHPYLEVGYCLVSEDPVEQDEETNGCSCSANAAGGSRGVLFGAMFLFMLAVHVGGRKRNGFAVARLRA